MSGAAADLLAAAPADVIVSVFFPLILPRALLSRLKVPALNIHPSLLPAYRGPSPLVAMLLDDTADRYGGVTLHRIDPRIDAGAIFGAIGVPPPADRHPRRWELALARAAARLTAETIPAVVRGTVAGREQDESAASYPRPKAADLIVTPSATRAEVDRLTATVGNFARFGIVLGGRRYDISAVGRSLGPARGAAPRIGWMSIDVDLADQRTRLRREMIWHGRRVRWETLLIRLLDRG